MDFDEERLFSNEAVKKEEIFDAEENQMQLTMGNGKKPSVKEEAVYTAVVKREVGDGEMLENGGSASREEQEFHGNRTNEQRNEEDEDEAEVELTEKPLRRRRCRVAKPKKFYGDFVDYGEESQESRKNQQKKGKGKRFPSRRMTVSDEAENEDEDVDQVAEEDDSVSGGNEEKRCPVDGCADKLGSSEELAKHMRKHPKPMMCGICNSSWPSGSDLRDHYRTHTGEKPFKCDVCKKTFRKASHLHLHQHIHTGERPYKCDECGYKPNSLSNLKRHKRTHTGEKPYECTICQKHFTRTSNLTTHRRTHTGERPYECDMCDYKTSRTSYLKNHQLTHTGEKAYVCTTCGYKASRSHHLSRHQKRFSH